MNEAITYINFIVSAATLLTVVFYGGSFIGKTNSVLSSLIEKTTEQNGEIERLKEIVITLRTLSEHYRNRSHN